MVRNDFDHLGGDTYAVKCKNGIVLMDSMGIGIIPDRTICIHTSGKYAYFKLKGKQIKLHRYLMGISDPKIQIDHINKEPLDNRILNLRKCSNKQNCRNRGNRKNSKIPYKGVTKTKEGNYMARIQVDGIRLCLGRFDTPEEAAKEYNIAAKKYHKEYARLNNV